MEDPLQRALVYTDAKLVGRRDENGFVSEDVNAPGDPMFAFSDTRIKEGSAERESRYFIVDEAKLRLLGERLQADFPPGSLDVFREWAMQTWAIALPPWWTFEQRTASVDRETGKIYLRAPGPLGRDVAERMPERYLLITADLNTGCAIKVQRPRPVTLEAPKVGAPSLTI
jgi:hypothetical protein